MSKAQIFHEMYLECRDIEFTDIDEILNDEQTEDEKEFIVLIYNFILQKKQKKVIEEKLF